MPCIVRHREGIDVVKLFVIYVGSKIYSCYSWVGCCLRSDVTTAGQVSDHVF